MVSWSLARFMVPGEHYCQGAITNCAGVSDIGSTVVRKKTLSSGATIRQSLASGNALPSTAGNAVFVQLEGCTPPWHGEPLGC